MKSSDTALGKKKYEETFVNNDKRVFFSIVSCFHCFVVIQMISICLNLMKVRTKERHSRRTKRAFSLFQIGNLNKAKTFFLV